MFNHQARWDRDLPCGDISYGPVIAVTCLMDKGKIIPRSFFWNKRCFSIQKIHFQWTKKQGKEEIFFYSVQTPAGAYELVLRTGARLWHLMRLAGP